MKKLLLLLIPICLYGQPDLKLLPIKESMWIFDVEILPDDIGCLDTAYGLPVGVHKNLLAIPKVPTIGYIAPGGSSDALRLSRQVDPLGRISALPCVPSLMISFFDLSSLVSGALAKVLSTVVNAMVKAFLDLAKKIGLFKLLQMLNQLASELRAVSQLLGILSKLSCVITPLTGGISAADYALARAITELNNMVGYVHGVTTAISSEIQATIFAVKSTALPASNIKTSISAVPLASLVVTQPPTNFVQSYVSIKNDPFPGYIGWYDPLNPGGDKVYTLRNGQPNYNSAQEHLEGEMQLQFSKNISSGFTSNTNTIVSNDLLKTVDHTVTTAAQYANSATIFHLNMQGEFGLGEQLPSILNNSGTGTANTIGNGDLGVATQGATANSSYTLIVSVRKNNAQYQRGQLNDPAAFNYGPYGLQPK